MNKHLHRTVWLILTAFIFSATALYAQPYPDDGKIFWARVTRVIDGDTVKVVRKNDNLDIVTIRLYGIDAPESDQPHGKQATNFLKRMINKKIVVVEEVTKDRYGRTVGLIKHEGKNVNREMLEAGWAWVYAKYCKGKPCKGFWPAVRRAQKAQIGLWSKQAMPPWDWRKRIDDD